MGNMRKYVAAICIVAAMIIYCIEKNKKSDIKTEEKSNINRVKETV